MSDLEKANAARKKALEIKERPSLFDTIFSTPWSTANSEFKGFYMLMIYIITVGIGIEALIDLSLKGYLFEAGLLRGFIKELQYVFTYWACLCLYSLTAFVLQKLLLCGLPIWTVRILQHITQTIMFLLLFALILNQNWFISHNLLLGMTACVLLLKTHSYTSVNIALREEYLKSKKRDGPYPSNISLRNFAYFMVIPCFVYQPKYETKGRPRISYLILKAFLFIFSFIKCYQLTTNHIWYYSERYHAGKVVFLEMYLRLIVPMGVLLLALIIMVFDFCCTFIAELTRYPDLLMYEDFWNSSTMTEFLSKMNRLIPNFFRVHLLDVLVRNYGMTYARAKTVSFICSVMLMEILMALLFKLSKPYFLMCVVVTYPIYKIVNIFKDRYVGNFVFLMLYVSLGPLVICLYIRDYVLKTPYIEQ